MNIRLLLILFLLSSIHFSFSQELPKIVSNSPDVASLGKYLEYPVDISTGIPQIDIPLYTIKSGLLELPISISYHASGIRVDEESSSVGLGWSLNAGGVISRVIKDGPDEANGDPNDFIYKGNNLPHYNAVDNIAVQAAGANGNDSTLQSYYGADSEPDIFSINALGLSGQFCLDNTLKFVGLGYEPYKYEVNLYSKSIVITNEKGDTYRFGKSLKNQEAFESTSETHNSLDASLPPEDSSSNNAYYNSSYHLTEIISYNRQDTIFFHYKNSYYSNVRATSSTRYVLNTGPLNDIDQKGMLFNGLTTSVTSTDISNVRTLDKIEFKNGTVQFNLVRDRIDMSQGMEQQFRMPRIEGFTVYDKNQKQLTKISFDNNYYFDRIGTGSDLIYQTISAQRKKSLKLNGVKFYTSSNLLINNYNFEYNPTPLPPINTSSQDFWGYYNGKANSTLIPKTFYKKSVSGQPLYTGDNRESDINFMKAAVLVKVVLPTKGYISYDFEPHYYLPKQQAEGKTLQNKSISLYAINRLPSCPDRYLKGIPSNNTLEFQVSEEISNNGIDSGILTVMFSDYVMLNGAQSMTCKLTDLDSALGGVYFFEHTPSNKNSNKVFTQNITIIAGHRYRIEANTNGVTGSSMSPCNSPYIEVKLTYNYWQPTTPLQIVPKQAGGLRIKAVTTFDSSNLAIKKKKYEYGDINYGSDNVGIGTLISEQFNNFYIKPRLYRLNNGDDELKDVLWFTSSTQSGLGLNNGSPVDYNKVTEYTSSLNNNNETNGKIEYQYSSTGRDVEPRASKYYPYSSFVYPAWKKSNLLSVNYYRQEVNKSYVPVRSEKYEYFDMPEKRIKTLKIIEVEPDVYAGFGFGSYYLDNNLRRFYRYNFYESIGKRVLSKKTELEYVNGIVTMSSPTNYVYGNPSHMQITSINTTSSDGTLLRNQMVYPQDISSPSAAELNLISKNRLNIPIKVETFKKQGSQAEEKLSSEYTIYNHQTWPGQNLPSLLKTSKGLEPLQNRIVYHHYYNNGNIKEVSKADGSHTVYIWGYRGEYPIAKLENATYTQIASVLGLTTNQLDAYNETNMSKINNLRNLSSSAMVTTYTYDPLIGITSITDPKGDKVTYIYDTFGRLQYVKDANENILSENEYHYKN